MSPWVVPRSTQHHADIFSRTTSKCRKKRAEAPPVGRKIFLWFPWAPRSSSGSRDGPSTEGWLWGLEAVTGRLPGSETGDFITAQQELQLATRSLCPWPVGGRGEGPVGVAPSL